MCSFVANKQPGNITNSVLRDEMEGHPQGLLLEPEPITVLGTPLQEMVEETEVKEINLCDQ